MQKRQIINNHSENNHFGRYLKLLKSFDIQEKAKKKKSSNSIIYFQKQQTKDLVYPFPKKISLPKTTCLHQPQQKDNNLYFGRKMSQITKRSRSTDLQSGLSDSKLYPVTRQHHKKYQTDQKSLIYDKKHYKHQKRIKTQQKCPIDTKFPKIIYNKLKGTTSGNLLQYSRLKPTQKYFTTLQNVKLAQRLLLAEPSKNVKRTQLNKFYQQQTAYRHQISQNKLILKNLKIANLPLLKAGKYKKKKSHKRNTTEWID